MGGNGVDESVPVQIRERQRERNCRNVASRCEPMVPASFKKTETKPPRSLTTTSMSPSPSTSYAAIPVTTQDRGKLCASARWPVRSLTKNVRRESSPAIAMSGTLSPEKSPAASLQACLTAGCTRTGANVPARHEGASFLNEARTSSAAADITLHFCMPEHAPDQPLNSDPVADSGVKTTSRPRNDGGNRRGGGETRATHSFPPSAQPVARALQKQDLVLTARVGPTLPTVSWLDRHCSH
jgi:hypothetical protein